ncbi:unnamed protein product [Ectocarpus sp. 6 AP-2014]
MRVWLLLQLLLLLLCYNQHGAEGSSRSVESAYDSNKGVFSPQGRLVQLDYVEGLVKRGNLCIGAECKDGVVLMTNKLVTADAAKLLVDGGTRRVFRVDSHIGILPAGLPADGRALAHKAMEYCRSHRREYGEPIPGRLLAERLGEFIHAACVRWGSRAYPNALFVACWGEGAPDTPASLRSEGDHRSSGSDANVVVTGGKSVSKPETKETAVVEKGGGGVEPVLHDDRQPVAAEGMQEEEEEDDDSDDGEGLVMDRDAGFQLYVVDPGGAVRRHRAACTGRGSSRARKWLHRRVTGAAAPAPAPGKEAASGGASGVGPSASAEREKNGGWSPEAGGRDDAAEEYGDDRSTEESGGGGNGSGEDSDWRGTQGAPGGGVRQRGRRRQQPPFSQMTCAEAARAMVREARRVRAGEPGKAGGGGSEAVAGLPEVAWLSIDKGGEPVFVHHRSTERLFKSGE